MPHGIDFLEDFDGFSVPKWSQGDSKILLKIDVYLERHLKKKLVFPLENNDFDSSGGPIKHPKSTRNPSKI